MHRDRVRGFLGILMLSALGASACGSSEGGGLFGPPADGDTGTDVSTDDRSTDRETSEPNAPDAGDTTAPDTSSEPDAGEATETTDTTETTTEPPTDTSDTPSIPGWAEHCTIAFDNLENESVLEATDDEQGTCEDGIQHPVELQVEAPDGEIVRLQIGANPPLQAEVQDGRVSFEVTLDAQNPSTLSASLAAAPACQQTIGVSGACFDPLQCEVSFPVKALLNGRPSPEGDRTSPENLPFRTRVEVTTNAADGELVLLQVDGSAGLAGFAADGRAVFSAVELASEGAHQLVATCHSNGATAESDPRAVHVDTMAPTVPVAGISPSDGVHLSPDADLDPDTEVLDFDVCVPVHSPDALDLAGAAAENIHVALGTQAARTAAAVSGGLGSDDGGCVRMQCPGRAAFDLNVSVFDQAGNVFRHTISGMTCASSLPSIEIISLQDASDDGVDADPEQFIGRRLLAANAPEGQLKDEEPQTAGAQHTLVACTDAPAGSARVLAGLADGTLTERATTTTFAPAQPSDHCPASLGYVIRFPGATLPQSTQPSAESVRLSEIVVEVTDELSETNRSSPVRLWVDTIAPSAAVFSLRWPGGKEPSHTYGCDDVIFTEDPIAVEVAFQSTGFPDAPLQVWLEGESPQAQEATRASDWLDFNFDIGSNTLVGETADAAGNSSLLPACSFFVGDPAVTAWVSPSPAVQILNSSAAPPSGVSLQDADDGEAGWQGVFEVTVTNLESHEVDAASLQFFANNQPVGDPIALAAAPELQAPELDEAGVMKYSRVVTLDLTAAGLRIEEGPYVTLRAEIAGADDPSRAFLRNLLVDVTAPDEPESVVPRVGPNPGDRRQTRLQLNWQAPGDGGAGRVASYAIAYDTAPITDLAAFSAATPVDFTTTPALPGGNESIMVSDLTIETVYHFAVRAVDAAGNWSGLVQAVAEGEDSPGLAARFKALALAPPDASQTARFGHQMDGSTDLTGDGLADLLVSSLGSGEVYLFKGEPDGYAAEPLITFRSDPSTWFGYSIAVVGDINADQAGTSAMEVARSQDIVLVEHHILGQRAYVIFGRDWEDAGTPRLFDMTAGDYDAVINLGPGGSDSPGTFEYAQFTFTARIGDFNSDGIDDFVIGAPFSQREFNGPYPGAVIVMLGSADFSDFTVADASSFGTRALAMWADDIGGRYTRPIVGLPPLGGGIGTRLLTTNANVKGVNPSTLFLVNDRSLNGQMMMADAIETWAGPSSSTANEGGGAGFFGYGVLSNSGVAVSSTNTQLAANQDGVVDVFFASSGHFFDGAPGVRFYDSTVTGNDNFGRVTVGNGFSGRTSGYATSFIGDALNQSGARDPDLVLGAKRVVVGEGGTATTVAPTLYFIPGSTLQQLSGTVDLANTPEAYAVRYELGQLGAVAQNWEDSEAVAIRDMDGDGYGDIAVSESTHGTDDSFAGRVIVLY